MEFDPGEYRVHRRLSGEPLVSFLLPTGKSASIRGGPVEPLVLRFIESVEERTTYRNFEYVICYDSEMSPAVLAEAERRSTRPVTYVEYAKPPQGFNFATKVNMAAVRASGEYLIVLNDDLEMITPDWVEELIGHAQDPTVGAVGGMYYFEDDTIQHAGVACADGPCHLAYGLPRRTSVFGGHLQVARECSVLTGACLAVRRDAFFAVGGLTERLPNNFNDVDFCLKLRSSGLRNIWTPYVEMYHFESKSQREHGALVRDSTSGRALGASALHGPVLTTPTCKAVGLPGSISTTGTRLLADWPHTVTNATRSTYRDISR